ncbi:MAG: HU family DNA-binding protein [Nitrospiria bacterium]
MTKAELINRMADSAGISKVATTKALNSLTSGVIGALKKGQKVSLVGFGTFTTSKRKARIGRNPRTGDEIKIPAMRVPKFRAGKALKSAVR